MAVRIGVASSDGYGARWGGEEDDERGEEDDDVGPGGVAVVTR